MTVVARAGSRPATFLRRRVSELVNSLIAINHRGWYAIRYMLWI